MISPEKKSVQPIILCHAACTGGSLIYRLLVSNFGLVGISEVGHVRRPGIKSFLPLDPEALLYGQGAISSKQFADIFFNRIRQCENRVTSAGKVLLIREHSHQYFFNTQQQQIALNSVSWINDSYCSEIGEPLICLVSVRDPIDSWLGLRKSFPNEKPSEFDEYCEKYLIFLDMVEKTKHVYLFKYEDMVSDPLLILNKIGKFIDCSPINFDLEKYNDVASSGNSGRQSSSISARPRRPFTMRLVKAAEASMNYKELCERLDYPCLFDDISFQKRCGLLQNRLNSLLHDVINKMLRPINQLASKIPLIRD